MVINWRVLSLNLLVFLLLIFFVFISSPTYALALLNYNTISNSIITEATVSSSQIKSINNLVDAQIDSSKIPELIIVINTDKSTYFSGDFVDIKVSSNYSDTKIKLTAELPNGKKEAIGEFKIVYGSYHSYQWKLPEDITGKVTINCEAEATYYVTYIYELPVKGKQQLERKLTVNKSFDIQVYKRIFDLSGTVRDQYGYPISEAIISILDRKEITTDADGHYKVYQFQFPDNYKLEGQIPTAYLSVAVKALACEPFKDEVKLSVTSDNTDINFTLRRLFLPPGIDLSKFTFNNIKQFPNYDNMDEWKDILGFTVDKSVELVELSYQTKNINVSPILIDDKKLFLIPHAKTGNYFIGIKSSQINETDIFVSAAVNGHYMPEQSASVKAGKDESKRFRIVLNSDNFRVENINEFSPITMVIPIFVGLCAGMVIAFVITSGRLNILRKAIKRPSGNKK